MADGFARSSGQVGVAFTSGGPGALNTLTAMSTAYNDSSPVLHILNENPAHVRKKGKGYFHDISDQYGVFRPVSDFGYQATLPEEIPVAIHQAMYALRNRRPRPAVVEIAAEAFEMDVDVELAETARRVERTIATEEISAVAELISTAHRPVIWAGGGVVAAGATEQLTQLVQRTGAPVLTSQTGKGSIRADHPLHVGNWANEQPVRELLATADLLIAIGTRFSYFPTGGWSLELPDTIVQIDIDPAEIGRNYRVTAGVVGDATASLSALLGRLDSLDYEGLRSREDEVAATLDRIRAAVGQREELEVLDQIRQALPESARVFNDPTTLAFWARSAWPAYQPRTWFVPSGFGTLGFALPATIGAKVATPEHPCVAIIGDAGSMFTIQDLMTAVQENVSAIIMIFNDMGYGVERRHQDHLFGRHSGVDVTPPDFVAVAEAFGATGVRVDDLSAVGTTLESALDIDGPVVIEVPNQFSHPGYGAWAGYE